MDVSALDDEASALADYRTTARSASRLVYTLVLVTRRRRRLFAAEAVRTRVRTLMVEAAREIDCRVATCEVAESTVTIRLDAPPDLAPQTAATRLQTAPVAALRAEVEAVRRAGSVFSRQYLVSTEPVSAAVRRAFAERVPRRS